MYHTNFVHLHVHSHYSLLDGAAPVKAIVAAARRQRMPALALTDHGNMFGAIEFYNEAIKKGVKPIIGFETYLAPYGIAEKSRTDLPNFHLVLLAINLDGYKNLVKLSTLAWKDGFYSKPRIDIELLEKYHEGILALSGCLQGEVNWRLAQGDFDAAVKAAYKYKELFGADNFYLEIQDHGLQKQRETRAPLIELAKKTEIPLVATNDTHYVNPEDWEAQDALMCLQLGKTLSDPSRFKFESREFYMKSPEAMTALFSDIPEAITNTLRVAEKCNVKLKLEESILPHFPIPEGKTSASYLEELCRLAIPGRYPEADESVMNRLEFELGVMRKMGFCDYFLIVWDFIRHAREISVPVGPGRGSAAGSIIAYLLGITDIDPLKYGLLFERFLNPERISMPDIDIDFSDDGRDRVIDYVVEKYGRERVSKVITFNFLLAKLAIRDIGRVLGVPLSEVDRIAKLVPEKPGTHLKDAMKSVAELREIAESGTPEHQKLLRIAATVDGLVRHTGIHACGIVISRDDLMDIVPLYMDKSKELITQYEKDSIEKIGLLKMDFLGLKTLTVIQRALEYIEKNHNLKIDISRINFDDAKTFDLFKAANTLGVFQLESSGMRALIAKLQPSVFEDIIALLAMYRPGPLGSGMVEDFVARKHRRRDTAYPHPDLEPILQETYGVFLYQEQVMKTANVLANFTMAQADALRKAMGKKIPEDMEKMGKLFVEGAVARGISGELAKSIYDLMASFAEYGFNKSHSAAYAVVTMRTAYLKAHYPAEFMAAVLSSEIADTDKVALYISGCREMGIPVLPPDINKSDVLFTVENGAVRFGLSAVKGVGAGGIKSLVEARRSGGPFKSFSDLTRRVSPQETGGRAIEALVKAGAMSGFGLTISQLLAMAPDVLKAGQQSHKERAAGQTTFFDLLGSEAQDIVEIDIAPPNIKEFPENELVKMEKEVLGFYLTNDPFKAYIPLAGIFCTHSLEDCKNTTDGAISRTAGMLTGFKKHSTKKGDVMAFLSLEAENNALEVTVFPKVYEQVAARLIADEVFFTVIRTQYLLDEPKFNAEAMFTLRDLNEENFSEIVLTISPERAKREIYEKILDLFRRFPGKIPVKIEINTREGEKVVIAPPSRLRIELCPDLAAELQTLCGEKSVRGVFPALDKIAAGKENGRNGYARARSNGGG